MYLHILNPHSPYAPPPPFDRMWTTQPFPPRLAAMLQGDVNEQWKKLLSLKDIEPKPTPEEIDYLLAMYDSEIAYVDWTLGNLFRWLQRFKLTERTLIVITADHGEYFGEHGLFGHAGLSLYNPVLSIPLMLVSPRLFPEQVRVTDAVEAVDIYPTLMEIVGGESPPHLQGENLLQEPRPGIAVSQASAPYPIKVQTRDRSLILEDPETLSYSTCRPILRRRSTGAEATVTEPLRCSSGSKKSCARTTGIRCWSNRGRARTCRRT